MGSILENLGVLCKLLSSVVSTHSTLAVRLLFASRVLNTGTPFRIKKVGWHVLYSFVHRRVQQKLVGSGSTT